MEQPTWPTCQHTVDWEIFVIRIFLSEGMKIEHAINENSYTCYIAENVERQCKILAVTYLYFIPIYGIVHLYTVKGVSLTNNTHSVIGCR